MVSKTLVMAVLMLLFSCGNASKKEAKTAEKPAMEHSEHQMTQAEAILAQNLPRSTFAQCIVKVVEAMKKVSALFVE